MDIRTGAAVNEWTSYQGSILDLQLGRQVEGTLVTDSDDRKAIDFNARILEMFFFMSNHIKFVSFPKFVYFTLYPLIYSFSIYP